MAYGYDKVVFDLAQDTPLKVSTFLEKFDAFYTLNLDSLIEQKYAGRTFWQRFVSMECPGIKVVPNGSIWLNDMTFPIFEPDPTKFELTPNRQPYIKLHGSFDWVQDEDHRSLLIIGGNKHNSISKVPLLSWYHDMFREDLHKPHAKLMVIGYSFKDSHINEAIIKACKNGLRVFIIDTLGVDVLRCAHPDLVKAVQPRIVGASRRYLKDTFSTDIVEFMNIQKFFGS
jgi:hypothetical protein